ncbi:MAG: YgjV family protein [Bacilli bacterium]|nr:YgjV family protein [Bacilli bacterium]
MISFIIAQVFGVCIFILNIITFSYKETNKVLLFNGLANALSIIQYILLGAYTGALCCTIAVTRNVIFSKFKDKVPVIYLIIYVVLVIIINASFVKSIIDIIPIINIIIFAIALWTKKIKLIKVVGIFTCVDGVFYDFVKKAYTSIINEVIDGVVGVICLLRIKKDEMVEKN